MTVSRFPNFFSGHEKNESKIILFWKKRMRRECYVEFLFLRFSRNEGVARRSTHKGGETQHFLPENPSHAGGMATGTCAVGFIGSGHNAGKGEEAHNSTEQSKIHGRRCPKPCGLNGCTPVAVNPCIRGI
ncbi:hypothetical protein CDAR_315561 [Caerostris darwini]|uniref:Uncharacterized protein n=1 Tax=Caerostris darwini TaxID=1538125 RepID=A0AAV4TR44_9ARAC|nr:hypothetical protein CDAR_315561 [Caerostris darwini]